MIVEQRILDFEKMGLGMFVHFGLYSVLGKGEWSKHLLKISDEDYEPLKDKFNPEPDWAERLVATAKNMGCRYITLTTRHHDGFSLYDTCGLNDYDAPHSAAGRDLVREFVDGCRKAGIIPFFYHTLLDWREPSYKEDFPEYLKYLRKSVEILCTNYGKIGGFWFDGKWDKKEADWEEDALYGMIRKYQPDTMIINNTGLSHRGELGHIELDSVTFERGRPGAINLEDSPKYIASEMCQTLGCVWGFGEGDMLYKSPDVLIGDICTCRKFGANFLLNVGPMGNGLLRPLDIELLKVFGKWVSLNDEALHEARPTSIAVKDKAEDFLLKSDKCYYLFCYNVGMGGDGNVVIWDNDSTKHMDVFSIPEKIVKATWLDNGKEVKFEQNGDEVNLYTVPFAYGTNMIIRVAKLEIEK